MEIVHEHENFETDYVRLLPTIQLFVYENVIHSFLLFISNLHSTGNCELYAHKFFLPILMKLFLQL